jgi:hypothetical protein
MMENAGVTQQTAQFLAGYSMVGQCFSPGANWITLPAKRVDGK